MAGRDEGYTGMAAKKAGNVSITLRRGFQTIPDEAAGDGFF